MEVAAEDQKRICQFSVLTAKQHLLEDELQSLSRDIAAMRDAKRGLEMILDEDEPVLYRCGFGFAEVSYENAGNFLNDEEAKLQRRAADTRAKLEVIQESLPGLKKTLTAKFGDSIRLEM